MSMRSQARDCGVDLYEHDSDPDDSLPVDWYCQKCSTVSKRGERCKVCGKRERDKS